MQLHEIKPHKCLKKSKRRGRGHGSGHGKTSCRGHGGAKSRSGRLHYIGHEGDNVPFFRKLPKRGFYHPKKTTFSIINVADLQKHFSKDDTITIEQLFLRKLIKKRKSQVKLLGKGTVDKPLQVAVNAYSKNAKLKIEKAGGGITLASSVDVKKSE